MRNIYITAQKIYYGIKKGQKTETLQNLPMLRRNQRKNESRGKRRSISRTNPKKSDFMHPEEIQSEDTQPSTIRDKKAVREEQREILKSADVVLTGGHGGAVPAFFVWLTKKLFLRSKD